MTRLLSAVWLLVSLLGAAAAADDLPTREQAEEVILRDLPRVAVFRTNCEGMSHTYVATGSDASDFDYKNPFRTVYRFPSLNPSAPSVAASLRSMRALVRIGLMVEEPWAGGGAQFRFTEKGWAQIRPGSALCLEWGTYDRMRVAEVVPQKLEDRTAARVTFEISFSSANVLEPWARDPEIRAAFSVLSFYYPSTRVPVIMSKKEGRWSVSNPVKQLLQAPAISSEEVLALARREIPEIAATEACFPLPGPRPQLGIEVSDADGYRVNVLQLAGLNRTQTAFIEDTLKQLEDMSRSAIFVREGPRTFRLDPNLKPRYRRNCVVVGASSPRVLKVSPYSVHENHGWFKIMLDVKEDPAIARTKASDQKDVRQFISRGSACEGWLRYRGEWRISSSRCYAAY